MISSKRNLRRANKRRFCEEGVNPMENLANLVDVMLVFACALMIAIITYWKVDLNSIMGIVSEDDLEKVEDYTESIESNIDSNRFESKGTVYEDPETGDLYIISK